MTIPIVDSHIHLFPASHLKTLAWYSPSSALDSQHSVDEYKLACAPCLDPDTSKNSATGPAGNEQDNPNDKALRGFIFIESDRISGLEPSQWGHVLDEVSFLSRVAQGKPVPGEGHSPGGGALCLGIVPWAPVPAGPDVLSTYLDKVRERCAGASQGEDTWQRICGVRYLLQDKPPGVMLQPEFIQSLKWLGSHGLAFDLGVDQRQGGSWQLEETVRMLEQVNEVTDDQKPVNIVISMSMQRCAFVEIDKLTLIDHLCKPNLLIAKTKKPADVLDDPDYKDWKRCITQMSKFPNTYMKLSGGFSELPPQPESLDREDEEKALVAELAESIRPWTSHVLASFSPSRVLFDSDWPVCNINGGGNNVSWRRWAGIVERVLDSSGLSLEEKAAIWGRNSLAAYSLPVDG
ncbi:hypothetical protein KEM56_006872 [Ascosphaera pollenicola]|nr:hypothetical protein KEM56_006872 [Ascosphaera pollenicola]